MIKSLLSSALILFTFFHLFAQNYSITGYVTDSASGERMIGANVVDLSSLAGTSTNNYGYFNLKVKDTEVSLQATYVGSKSATHRFRLTNDTVITIKILTSKELSEVVVASESNASKMRAPLGVTVLPVKKLTLVPSLGEPDILKSIQSQPGIKGGIEGSSGVYVRGGSSGENLFLLDDVPVYNVSHLYGFFSAFNSQAVKDLKLVKGCFPAHYGGRVSSVIDVRSMDGNNQKLKGVVSIGLISSQFTLHGPLWNEKTTFMLSARRSYFDLLATPLKSAGTLNKNFPDYYFYDVNARIAHSFSPKDKIYLNFYSGKDHIKNMDDYNESVGTEMKYSETNNQTSGWGNQIMSLRWNHVFGKSLFANTTIAYSTYNYFTQTNYNAVTNLFLENKSTTRDYYAHYTSDITDMIAKMDFEYNITSLQTLKFGFGNTNHQINPGENIYKVNDQEQNYFCDTSFTNQIITGDEFYFYVEDEIKFNDNFTTNVGLRLAGMATDGETSWNPEPRFSMTYFLSDNLAIKSGYSRMFQYLHLLSSSGVTLPTDIWVPATNGIRPLQSDQVNIGITYNWVDQAFFTLEFYQKWMGQTTDLANGASIAADITPWYNKMVQGRGNARGMELSVEKRIGKINGVISYTLSQSTRQFDELNKGRSFRFKYDRLHDLSLAMNYKLSDKWDFALIWYVASGYPASVPVAKYSSGIAIYNNDSEIGGVVYVYPSKNNYSLPIYHRLDIGIHYNNSNRWFQYAWSLDVFNAYNRKNPVYLYYSTNYPPSFKYGSFLPIIPTLSCNIKF